MAESPRPTRIFLSYRRADTAGYAGRLSEALRKRFGEGSVFQDVEAIRPGSDFGHEIDGAIARCQVLVVLIGDTWATERMPDGGRRLDDPDDFVRLEIATGLGRGTRLLPVLVEGARMPREDELPPDLKPLARVQALELSDSRWEYDYGQLVRAIADVTGRKGSRGARRAAMAAGVLLVLGAGGALYFGSRGPADVSGRWNLPSGSYWVVVQNGARLAIEEVHYESKQAWKRGQGTITGRDVSFDLELVFGGPHSYRGVLALAGSGATLSGTMETLPSGRKESLTLVREQR